MWRFCVSQSYKNWRKLKFLIFVKTQGHENCRKLSDFCVILCTRGMEIGENWSIWFLWNFVYPGSWKLEKIEVSEFFEILFTWGHEIEVSDFCEKSWKLKKNKVSEIFEILFTRGHEIEVSDFCEKSWKLEKIEASDFCVFLCTHWRKIKHLTFM